MALLADLWQIRKPAARLMQEYAMLFADNGGGVVVWLTECVPNLLLHELGLFLNRFCWAVTCYSPSLT